MYKKQITLMTKEDFKEVPMRKWDDDIGEFYSMVIIPTEDKHDNGYMCMEFCAVDRDNFPICRMSGGSDIVHIDGIGGFGALDQPYIREIVKPKRWAIDCLPCGYLRLFSSYVLTRGRSLIDFEVYGKRPIE